MNVEDFIDANVFIYRPEGGNDGKAAVSERTIGEGIAGGAACISARNWTDRNTPAAPEAAFRVDYPERRRKRKRDPSSRRFRAIYAAERARVSLRGDVFPAWKPYSADARRTISRVEGACRYGNWLAHGRYRTLEIGDPYDYAATYRLAEPAFDLRGDA